MRRRHQQRRTTVAAGLIVSGVLLSGCSTMADNARNTDLCTQFDQLVKAADEFRETDPAQVRADDLRARTDHLRDSVNQVQAVAEGRLDDVLSSLEATLNGLSEALTAAGQDARQAVAALEEDDVQAVLDRWAIVRDRVAAQCG
jgi:outer membrane murein-binding lipoprotein Lpp